MSTLFFRQWFFKKGGRYCPQDSAVLSPFSTSSFRHSSLSAFLARDRTIVMSSRWGCGHVNNSCSFLPPRFPLVRKKVIKTSYTSVTTSLVWVRILPTRLKTTKTNLSMSLSILSALCTLVLCTLRYVYPSYSLYSLYSLSSL